jgi:hypothetical protein
VAQIAVMKDVVSLVLGWSKIAAESHLIVCGQCSAGEKSGAVNSWDRFGDWSDIGVTAARLDSN